MLVRPQNGIDTKVNINDLNSVMTEYVSDESENLSRIAEWIYALRSTEQGRQFVGVIDAAWNDNKKQKLDDKHDINQFCLRTDLADIKAKLSKDLKTLVMCNRLMVSIVDHYELLPFDCIREHNLDYYNQMLQCVNSKILSISVTAMFLKYHECLRVSEGVRMGARHPDSHKAVKKKLNERYIEIEYIFNCSMMILRGMPASEKTDGLQFFILKIMIEVMVSRSRILRTTNKKTEVGDIYRLLGDLEGIAEKIGHVDLKLQRLNLQARIALNVERDIDKASRLANEVDAILKDFPVDRSADRQTFSHQAQQLLVKLMICDNTVHSGRKPDLSELEVMINTIEAGKESIATLEDSYQQSAYRLIDSVVSYMLSEAYRFHQSSDLNRLKDCRRFLNRLGQVIEIYAPQLIKISYAVVPHGIETQKTALDKCKKKVNDKINQLTLEELENRKNYAILQQKLADYDAEFEKLSKDLIGNTSQSRPLSKRHVQPQPGFVVLSEVIETQAPLAPAQVQSPSFAAYAVATLSSASTLAQIEAFEAQVLESDLAEALLYMGDRCGDIQLFGSALTYYNRSLTSISPLSPIYDELLQSITLSLEFTQDLLADQIRAGERILARAEADREAFIFRLGARSFMQLHPDAGPGDLKAKETQDERYQLGFAVFIRLGEANKQKGKHISPEAENMRNIKDRLAIFQDNSEEVCRLMDMAEEAKAKPAFPALSGSSVALFGASKALASSNAELAPVPSFKT